MKVHQKQQAETSKLSVLESAFYLVLIPLIFTASLHYISSKNAAIAGKLSRNIAANVDKLNHYMTDIIKFRQLLPFSREQTEF